MFWLIVVIIGVGYFVYWAIRQNTQVKAAIAIQDLEISQQSARQNEALDLSQYAKLPVATVQPSRVPIMHKTILAYSPKVGKWVYDITQEFRDTMTPFIETGANSGESFGSWELYTETLFFACGYVVENLRPLLNKHEQVYFFILMAGMAMFEDPNFIEPRSDNPSNHIASLMKESPISQRVRDYVAAESAKKLFAGRIKDWMYSQKDVQKKYLAEVSHRIDMIDFDSLLEA